MLIKVNLKLLEKKPALLDGEVPFGDLAPDFKDELVRVKAPVVYHLEVEEEPQGVHVVGRLETTLDCGCVRCLQNFDFPLVLEGLDTLGVFEGEDALVRDGDFADLTPMVREEILLALPTHPLCKDDCRGLQQTTDARDNRFSVSPSSDPVWGPLDNLKL